MTCPAAGASSGGVSVAVAVCPASGPGAITPSAQTSNVDGTYKVTFTMPALPAAGELYKIIPHAQSCTLPCESGSFDAAGS